MKVGYIRANTIIEQSQQIQILHEFDCYEYFVEKCDGQFNKEEINKIITLQGLKELVIYHISVLPFDALKSVEFIAFMHRKGVTITSISKALDIETILALDELQRHNRKEKSKAIMMEEEEKKLE